MLRKLLVLVGMLELLVPDRVITVVERFALENPGDCELRAWTVPMVRLEALVWLLVASRGDPHGQVRTLLALTCGPAALFPQRYIDIGARLVYDDPDRCEWTPWIVPATRMMGLAALLAALRARGEPAAE